MGDTISENILVGRVDGQHNFRVKIKLFFVFSVATISTSIAEANAIMTIPSLFRVTLVTDVEQFHLITTNPFGGLVLLYIKVYIRKYTKNSLYSFYRWESHLVLIGGDELAEEKGPCGMNARIRTQPLGCRALDHTLHTIHRHLHDHGERCNDLTVWYQSRWGGEDRTIFNPVALSSAALTDNTHTHIYI